MEVVIIQSLIFAHNPNRHLLAVSGLTVFIY